MLGTMVPPKGFSHNSLPKVSRDSPPTQVRIVIPYMMYTTVPDGGLLATKVSAESGVMKVVDSRTWHRISSTGYFC